jgi:hypothetical protein
MWGLLIPFWEVIFKAATIAALVLGGLPPRDTVRRLPALSMSRKADCYDNAPMESFFHTLKTELVHHRHYATREEATRDILPTSKSPAEAGTGFERDGAT